MMLQTISLRAFKAAVRKGNTSPVPLVKLSTATAEPMGGRQIKYTISTEIEDREGDVVSLSGWDLSAYKLNPVVLWGHEHHQLPIGRCLRIGTEDDALKAVVDYVPADMPVIGPFAEAVLRMSREGFLSATSVGFRPTEVEMAVDRMKDEDWFPPLNFLKQELLEFSVVSIPCNPEALIDPGERLSADELQARVIAAIEATKAAAEAETARIQIAHTRRRALLAACV